MFDFNNIKFTNAANSAYTILTTEHKVKTYKNIDVSFNWNVRQLEFEGELIEYDDDEIDIRLKSINLWGQVPV